MEQQSKYRKAFVTAFPYTIPIFAGFIFLGMAYGIYMHTSGFSFWYSLCFREYLLSERISAN